MGVCQPQRLVFIYRHLGNIDSPSAHHPFQTSANAHWHGQVVCHTTFHGQRGQFHPPKHPPAHVDVITPLPNHLAIGGSLVAIDNVEIFAQIQSSAQRVCPLPIDQLGRLAEFL